MAGVSRREAAALTLSAARTKPATMADAVAQLGYRHAMADANQVPVMNDVGRTTSVKVMPTVILMDSAG